MSEYPFVKFRAIDRQLTDTQLDFMELQSSRAEFTKWEFEVDYQYSSFRGEIDDMRRYEYNIFLTYANYGCLETRTQMSGGLCFAKTPS